MALIKKSELASMQIDQMQKKIEELKKEMMRFNTQRSMRITPENPGKIKLIRKTIARLHTFITIRKKAQTIQEPSKLKKDTAQEATKSPKKQKEGKAKNKHE